MNFSASDLTIPATVPITAILPAWKREVGTVKTIERIASCRPAPAEILVHLDGRENFPFPGGVRVLRSKDHVGPGGGRNLLLNAAGHELVASFDDDSYPEDSDFFARVLETAGRHPEAGIIACSIRHRDSRHDAATATKDRKVATFVGCGCVYHRSVFLKTRGYVPLPVAYGMEEIDLSLQLHALGIPIVESPDLKVFHDTDLHHHESPRITAGAIMNQALFAWRHYPVSCWPYGLLQWLNKIRDSLKRGRLAGTLRGMAGTPWHLWSFRAIRQPLSRHQIRRFRDLVSTCGTPGNAKSTISLQPPLR